MKNDKDASIEDLERLQRIEDELDRELMKEAMEEPGPNIPWEDVKKDLDL